MVARSASGRKSRPRRSSAGEIKYNSYSDVRKSRYKCKRKRAHDGAHVGAHRFVVFEIRRRVGGTGISAAANSSSGFVLVVLPRHRVRSPRQLLRSANSRTARESAAARERPENAETNRTRLVESKTRDRVERGFTAPCAVCTGRRREVAQELPVTTRVKRTKLDAERRPNVTRPWGRGNKSKDEESREKFGDIGVETERFSNTPTRP